MRTFVIGDIHGAYISLQQCLERSGFDFEKDKLISVGDIVDGWRFVKDCVDLLLTIPNRVMVVGNHDWWFIEYFMRGKRDSLWTSQGGDATLESYHDGIPEEHKTFFKTMIPTYVDNNKIYVHGGFDPSQPIAIQSIHDIMWDRALFSISKTLEFKHGKDYKISQYDEIFIGHTQVRSTVPLHYCNLWNMDTGAGWNGYLTIMNVDTKEFWNSDYVLETYHGENGRASAEFKMMLHRGEID